MRWLAWVFTGLGIFLVAGAIAYGLHSGEYEGDTLMATAAGCGLLVGGYLAHTLWRASTAGPADADDARTTTAESEPHVGPTVWPLVLSLSMIGLIVGAIGSHWILIVGAVVLIAGLVGWGLDVHTQWKHHFAPPVNQGIEPMEEPHHGEVGQ